jgi:hypothetical protein
VKYPLFSIKNMSDFSVEFFFVVCCFSWTFSVINLFS